jgi:hypothetical protein
MYFKISFVNIINVISCNSVQCSNHTACCYNDEQKGHNYFLFLHVGLVYKLNCISATNGHVVTHKYDEIAMYYSCIRHHTILATNLLLPN